MNEWVGFPFWQWQTQAIRLNVFIQQKKMYLVYIMFWAKQKSLRKIEKIFKEVNEIFIS